MKLLVIANCQGLPLARLLEVWFESSTVDVIAVHQSTQPSLQLFKSFLGENYDAVLTQPISETYPLEFARTARIKDAFKGKTFTWPNAYFRGYNPELQYLRRGGSHCLGPLGDYHVTTLIQAYLKGEAVEQAANLLADEDYNRSAYGAVAAQSLGELRERERSIDVPVASFIDENFAKQRLFYSFNHPSNRLLFELAQGLARKIGLKQKYPFQPGLIPEFLSHIRPPVNPCLKGTLAEASARRVYAGIAPRDRTYVVTGRGNVKLYTDLELASAFYSLYDQIELKAH